MLSFPMFSSPHTSLPAPTSAPHNHKIPCPIIFPATSLKSTVTQVFIPIYLKSPGINTYKKPGGRGPIIVN